MSLMVSNVFMIFCNVMATWCSRTPQLKAIELSRHNDLPQNAMICDNEYLMWCCILTGTRLQWNRLPDMTFSIHDRAHERVLFSSKYRAILLNTTMTADGEWQFTSQLYSLVPLSELTQNGTVPCTCSSNATNVKTHQVKIAGISLYVPVYCLAV